MVSFDLKKITVEKGMYPAACNLGFAAFRLFGCCNRLITYLGIHNLQILKTIMKMLNGYYL